MALNKTVRHIILAGAFCALGSTAACGPDENNGNDPVDIGIILEDMGRDDGAEVDLDLPPADQGRDLGEDKDDTGEDQQEMGQDMEADIPVSGDLGTPDPKDFPCFDELNLAWPFHDSVLSVGGLTATEGAGGVINATIDAAAGGSMNAINEPFLYIDLDTAEVVPITDLESLSDERWDLAFKRVVVRSNNGTSGVGASGVAKLSATAFDQVTASPVDTEFVADQSVQQDCTLITDPIGNPVTAFNTLNPSGPTINSGSWYDYGGNMGMLTPRSGEVYVIKNAEGTASYKFEFLSYMDGVYELRWQAL